MPARPPTSKKSHQGGPGLAKSMKKEGRDKRARSATAVNLSGSLKVELGAHAFERCRHYFLFIVAMKTIELLTKKANPGSTVTALSGIEVKATDQIDDGFRSANVTDYSEFPADDPMVIEKAATSFTKIDAAHFCNLGIKPTFAARIDLTNPLIKAQFEAAKTLAGNTRWLPQLVNIGPDRKVDVLHGKLAKEMLADAGPTVSRQRIKEYVAAAKKALDGYVVYTTKKKARGVGACAQCYIARYDEDSFVDSIYASVQGEITGWCSATDNRDLQPSLVSAL
jgi:hypothetical protein